MRFPALVFAVTLATLAGLCACKKSSPVSLVKFGYKTGAFGNGPQDSLYQMLPNQTLAVCNNQGVDASIADLIKQAVPYWLQPLGRDQAIKVVDGCQGDRVIQLVPTTDTYYAQTWPPQGNTIQMEIGPNFAPHFTDRHEVGHTFGFCDLYNPSSCSHNSSDPAPSLMGSGDLNGGQLSQGDLDGINAIVQEPELADATAAWHSYLNGSGTGATAGSDQGSSSQSSNQVSPPSTGAQASSGYQGSSRASNQNTQSSGSQTYGRGSGGNQDSSANTNSFGGSNPNDAQAGGDQGDTLISTIGSIIGALANGAKTSKNGLKPTPTPYFSAAKPTPRPATAKNYTGGYLSAAASVSGSYAQAACLCTRAQEAGCGVTRGGLWVVAQWYTSGSSECDADFCQTHFHDVVQNTCGGVINKDPIFH